MDLYESWMVVDMISELVSCLKTDFEKDNEMIRGGVVWGIWNYLRWWRQGER